MDEQVAPRLWQLPDRELAQALLGVEYALRRGQGRLLAILAEAESRGLARNLGYRDTQALLTQELRLSPREAKQRLAQTEATQPATAVSGTVRPAPLPATGAALAAGEISTEHVSEIGKIMAKVSGRVDTEAYAQAEHDLLTLAQQSGPAAVRKAGRHLLAYLDQDGKPPREDEHAAPRREFRCHTNRAGWMRVTGDLDPETAALLEGLLGTLAKPKPVDSEGEPDVRTTVQRQGDALAEIIDLAARADELSIQGGERAVMTVTTTLHDLRREAGTATLDGFGPTSVTALRRLACDANIIPAVLGSQGQILDLGRAARHASPAQRRAGGARQGLRPPRLRPAAEVVHAASHPTLGRRRTVRYRQHGAAMRQASPLDPPQRVGSPHPRAHPGVPTTGLARHRPKTPTQHRTQRATAPAGGLSARLPSAPQAPASIRLAMARLAPPRFGLLLVGHRDAPQRSGRTRNSRPFSGRKTAANSLTSDARGLGAMLALADLLDELVAERA